MKMLTVFLSLMLAAVLTPGYATAQSFDKTLMCEDAAFVVNNNSKRAILVVDVSYRPLLDGSWREFPNTKNRMVEPGGSVEWRRSVKGIEMFDSTRAKVRYKKRVGDRWVPVRREVRTRVDAMCFDWDTYFIFDVE